MIPKNMNQVTLKKSSEGVTGRMGLSWIAHCLKHFGVEKIIDKHFPVKKSPRAIAASRKIVEGALGIIAGGERLEDLEVLRADEGLRQSLGGKKIISPDTVREFIKSKRNGGRLRKSNEEMTIQIMKESKEKEFTYDNDATYFDSEKQCAEWSYQGRKQCSGLLGFIAELGICITEDFRSGNKSPRDGIINQLSKAKQMAKKAGKKITVVRMDAAGHQNRIFEECNKEGIRYYISLAKNDEVKESIKILEEEQWSKLPAEKSEKREVAWAETVYAPNEGEAMRMLVLRWSNPDPELFDRNPYCYHAIGTNDNEIKPMEWLKVHNGRMSSENYNKELKNGFGGGYTPCYTPGKEFDMNRNYFLLGVLAYNMVQITKLFYLGVNARKWTIKTVRHWFINVCGKIIKSGRRYICKIINATDETFALFENCLSKLVMIRQV